MTKKYDYEYNEKGIAQDLYNIVETAWNTPLDERQNTLALIGLIVLIALGVFGYGLFFYTPY